MDNNTIDFSFYLEPPERQLAVELQIEALAPLSLVSDQPGSYFRSAQAPTREMIWGMMENALGWHFDDATRNSLFKALTKQIKKGKKSYPEFQDHAWFQGKVGSAGSSYKSVLQFHVEVAPLEMPAMALQYDDLWSMQLSDNGINFVGGSRHYASWLERIINLSKQEDDGQAINKKTKKHPPFVSFGDRKEYVRLSLEELKRLDRGLVNTASINPFFPMYYSSPRKRAYVVPATVYRYQILTTEKLATLLQTAFEEPAAPLYLGTNDGWVDAKITRL